MITHVEACPIDRTLVDQNVIRLAGFVTILTLLLGYFLPFVWGLLLVDFVLRIKIIRLSPIVRLSKWLFHSVFKIKPKPINAEPKIFAAKIGLLFSLMLNLSLLFHLTEFKLVTLSLFLLAAGLETFFNYCLGCKIYQLLVELKIIDLKKSLPSVETVNQHLKKK